MDQDSGAMESYGVLSKEEKKLIFGVECPEKIEWKNWQTGIEYTKNLVLRNVSTKVIKVKYKQTSNKAFNMDFPEPFKISPGMTYSLKIVFRPLKLMPYDDYVEIICTNKSFRVPIKANIPSTRLEVPSVLDFGYVPTKESVSRTFHVKNTGDIKVSFSWKLDSPFQISPENGVVEPGASAVFHASFTPHEAASYEGSAIIMYNDTPGPSVKVIGIGKFPYLSIESTTLDFGNVLIGKSAEKTIRFGNHSASVPANFNVAHGEGADDGVYSISPAIGSLGPEEFSILQVTYTPKHAGTFSSEIFHIFTLGGNRLSVNIRGNAIGPTITASVSSLNFGNVQVDSSSTRVLYLQNHSDVAASYQLDMGGADIFTASKPLGTIPAQSTIHVTITCKASFPGNLWQRMVCLIKDADPLCVDLIATSYSPASRPPPLAQHHIVAYMDRLMRGEPPVDSAGYDAAPSPTTTNMDAVSGIGYPYNTFEGSLTLDGEAMLAPTTSLGSGPLIGPTGWDLFFRGPDPVQAVIVDTSYLDFGTCSKMSSSEVKSIVVTNRTRAKITARFVVPGWSDVSSGDAVQVFTVLPEYADVRPGASTTFRVAFRPPKDARFFCQTLLMHASVKSMRNFRLVTDDQVIPPWVIPIIAAGSSYLHSNPEFSPKIDLSHKSIMFSPCRVGSQSHQTVLLSNYGDTYVRYSFSASSLNSAFSIRPMSGIVPPHSHQILGMEFRPTGVQPVSSNVRVIFNNHATSFIDILLRGSGHEPRLICDVGSTLYFRPTCVGATAHRKIMLTNVSRVPTAFKWTLPSKVEGVISVTPISGVMRGNESMELTWTFAPGTQKTYDIRAACAITSPGTLSMSAQTAPEDPTSWKDQLALRLVGEGTVGAVALDPPSLDLGTVKVGVPVRRNITIANQSDGILRYSIEVVFDKERSENGNEDIGPPVEFLASSLTGPALRPNTECWIDEAMGSLPARASKVLSLTLWPRHRKIYSLALAIRTSSYSPVVSDRPPSSSSKGVVLGESASVTAVEATPPTLLAPIVASAMFPSVTVTDVYSDGLPKPILWSSLCLDVLNQELRSNVSEVEVELFKLDDKGKVTTELAMSCLAPFPLDMGILALGSSPRVVHLELSNVSGLEVQWELHSYDDPEMEMENWVEPGRPRDEAEKQRDFIVQHRIFEMRPRSGVLDVGKATTVTLVYNPTFQGFHDLPIFLQMHDGKRIHLRLRGTTVSEQITKLLLPPPARTFTLKPQLIGEADPPLQMYNLRNACPYHLTYFIDVSPLEQLTRENHGFEVLKLMSATNGEIPPYGLAPLQWQFAPVEAKTITALIDIHLGDGSMETITIVGQGFHPDTFTPTPAEASSEPTSSFPVPSPAAFSASPCAALNTRLALLDYDVINLGPILVGSLTRHVSMVTNKSRYPLLFSWDIAPLVSTLGDCEVVVFPAQGQLEPGERALCRVSFKAGLIPKDFDAEIYVKVSVDEAGENGFGADDTVSAAELLKLSKTKEVIEDVLAEQPPRPSYPYVKGSKLRSRLPVHMTMTKAIRARIPALDALHQNTLNTIALRTQEAALPPPLPPQQTICVSISGRVLSIEQARRCVAVQGPDYQVVAALLTGASWTAPVVEPWWDVTLKGPAPQLNITVKSPPRGAAPEKGASFKPACEPVLEDVREEEQVDDLGSAEVVQPESAGAEPGVAVTEELDAFAPEDPESVSYRVAEEDSRFTPQEVLGESSEVVYENAVTGGVAEPLTLEDQPPVEDGEEMVVTLSGGVGDVEARFGEEGASQVLQMSSAPLDEPVPEAETVTENERAENMAAVTEEVATSSAEALSADPSAAVLETLPSSERAGEGMEASSSVPPVTELPVPTFLLTRSQAKDLTISDPESLLQAAWSQAYMSAGHILQDVLLDVLKEPIVEAAFNALEESALPVFAEIRASGVPSFYSPRVDVVERPADECFADGEVPSSEPPVLSLPASSSQAANGMEETSQSAPSVVGVSQEQDNGALIEKLMYNPAFMTFAEFVLESSVLGLLQESVEGDWGSEREES